MNYENKAGLRMAGRTCSLASFQARVLRHGDDGTGITVISGTGGFPRLTSAVSGQRDLARRAWRRALAADIHDALHNKLERHDIRLWVEFVKRFGSHPLDIAVQARETAHASGRKWAEVVRDAICLTAGENDMVAATADRLFHVEKSQNRHRATGPGHIPWNVIKTGLASSRYDNRIEAGYLMYPKSTAGRDLNIRPVNKADGRSAAIWTIAATDGFRG